jgi:hypothetical protein
MRKQAQPQEAGAVGWGAFACKHYSATQHAMQTRDEQHSLTSSGEADSLYTTHTQCYVQHSLHMRVVDMQLATLQQTVRRALQRHWPAPVALPHALNVGCIVLLLSAGLP